MASPRLATFSIAGSTRYGAVVEWRNRRSLRAFWQGISNPARSGRRRRPDKTCRSTRRGVRRTTPLDAITWLPPIPAPEKIICIGVNYPDRNAEYRDGQDAPKYPSMFMRTPRSFVGHQTPLVRPRASAQLDYEGELVLIIGKAGAAHRGERGAGSHRGGHAVQRRHHPRLGPACQIQRDAGQEFRLHRQPRALARALHRSNPQIADIRLTTRVNGETRQDDRTGRLIFGFRYLINYISTFTTLVPGDVIVTGTPTGAGARFDPPRYLKPGDVVEVEADNIGVLRNGVIDETP